MKKILALAVGMLLIPFTAFGMQMMSDSDMDSITGQSGVAISLDNIQIFSNSGGSELWYETGLTGDTSMAAVGIVYGESPSYLFINKISNPAGLGAAGGLYGTLTGGPSALGTNNDLLRGDYSALAAGEPLAEGLWGKGPRQYASVLSIRVAQHNAAGVFGPLNNPAVSAFNDYAADGAYVEIGLPTIEIYSAEGSYDSLRIFVMGDGVYGAGSAPIGAGTVDNRAYSLGSVYTTDAGSTTAILGGRIGITSLGQVPQFATSSGLADDMTESDPWAAVGP